MTIQRARREVIRRERLQRKTIGNEFGKLLVQRTRRAVRITAITTKADGWTGKDSAASFAFVDLDDACVDRLIRRLQAIRGGRKTIYRVK